MSPVLDTLLLIGSHSIHTHRFLAGIAPHCRQVVLISNGEPGSEWCPPNLLEVVQVDFGLRAWRTARRIRQVIAQYQPQLVHVHQANSVAWHARRALKGSALPMVLSCWGSDVLLLPKRSPLHHWMVRGNLRAARLLTADSQVLLQQAQKVAGQTVAGQWLLFGLPELPSPPLDLASRPKRMLSCRLHKPLYRVDAILRAVAVLQQRGQWQDWQLEVAASGPDTPALQALARELGLGGSVQFTGFMPHAELLQAYARSRLFVSVPESDSTPVSLLEAMAYGCLPVLSDLPANREWVEDGQQGFICRDVKQLTDDLWRAMQWCEQQPERWQQQMLANHQRIRETAWFPQNMAQCAALYQRILEGRA